MTTRSVSFDSAVATGRGDDGTTGLLFGGERVRKDDPRTEAYGALDEAVAALGMARAELAAAARQAGAPADLGRLGELVLRLQRELFVAAAELATNPDARDRQRDGATRVSAAMVDDLEAVLRDAESAIELPREFVVPGETRASAALELARTILRRAERRTVTLVATDEALATGLVLAWLNRLADLLWVLARAAEQAESRTSTVARVTRQRPARHPEPSPERSEA